MTDWSKVEKNGPIEPGMTTPCWLWLGAVNGAGYGPHRDIYEEKVGSIPQGHELDHLCGVKLCVRYTDHMEVVTRSEHNRRTRARRPAKKRLGPDAKAAIHALLDKGWTDKELSAKFGRVVGNFWYHRNFKAKGCAECKRRAMP